MGGGAEILCRVADWKSELVSDVEWQIGVAEELAGDEDQVGFFFGEDGAGLGGGGDQADGGGHHAGFAADAFGEGDLVAGGYGNFCVGRVAAAGAIDQVDAQRGKLIG